MGCENAVMVLISEISVLQEWKVGEQGKGSLSIWALVDKARWILEALEREIERLEICLTNNVAIKSGEVYIITNIYACAALVFLQTGKSGLPI